MIQASHDLSAMRSVNIQDVDRTSLVDLNSVTIDESLPVPERVASFLEQIKKICNFNGTCAHIVNTTKVAAQLRVHRNTFAGQQAVIHRLFRTLNSRQSGKKKNSQILIGKKIFICHTERISRGLSFYQYCVLNLLIYFYAQIYVNCIKQGNNRDEKCQIKECVRNVPSIKTCKDAGANNYGG